MKEAIFCVAKSTDKEDEAESLSALFPEFEENNSNQTSLCNIILSLGFGTGLKNR